MNMKIMPKKLWIISIISWVLFGFTAIIVNEHFTRGILEKIGSFIWNCFGIENPPEYSCLPHPIVKYVAYGTGGLLVLSICMTIVALVYSLLKIKEVKANKSVSPNG